MKKILIFIMIFATTIFANNTSTYTKEVSRGKAVVITELPKGMNTLSVSLESDKDLDLQLYAEDGHAIIAYQDGVLKSPTKDTLEDMFGMRIVYSGYNGINGKPGHEYINITGTSHEKLTVKVYGYRAGKADVNVTYSLDDNSTRECTREYKPVCGEGPSYCAENGICTADIIRKTHSNMCELKKAQHSFLYEGKCKIDDNENNETNGTGNCTKEYKPVCAIIIHGDDFENNVSIEEYKTFSNMCLLKNNPEAIFAYEGECNVDINETNETESNETFICPTLYKPVCGVYDNLDCIDSNDSNAECFGGEPQYQTFNNMCGLEHDINGAKFAYEGECKKDNNGTKGCTKEYKPVCGVYFPDCKIDTNDSNMECGADEYKTFSNMCVLENDPNGAAFAYEGECKGDTNGTQSYEANITIKPEKVDCFALTGQWTECMIIQEEGSDVWKSVYANIEGFTYEEGYSYKLLAKITPPSPMMAGAITEYKLIDLSEKNKVKIPENIDAPVCVNLGYCLSGECTLDNPQDNYRTFKNLHKFELYEGLHPIVSIAYEGKCKVDNNSTYIAPLTIKSHKKDCITSSTGPTKCMQVEENGSNVWENVFYIENFNYEEGYNYKILAEITKNNTNLIGLPPKSYKLIDVIDKYLDDNSTVCTAEYKPVCGITNPCPIGTLCKMLPIYKTFGNMCELDVAKAEFAYPGKCKVDTNTTYKAHLTIMPYKKDCNTPMATKCMQVKEEGSTVWEYDNVVEIENFDYEEGYYYKIVAEITKHDVYIPEASPKSYKLIKVIDKYLDDNSTVCTADYKPVCGIINPCPIGALCKMLPIYKTFGNICKLDVAKADFAYDGVCKGDTNYKTNIIVKSKKVKCSGLFVPESTQCLQIQEEGTNVWKSVLGIKNFSYQEGYKYKILAKVSKNDPLLMDAPSKYYELIKVLEKNPVDINITVCPAVYEPVCGIINPCPIGALCKMFPIYKTFGNGCELDVAKAKFAYEGKCKDIIVDDYITDIEDEINSTKIVNKK